MMKISDAGIALIKSFEGLRLEAYPDPATNGEPFTIGYGSTEGVYEGMTITEDEAEARLHKDVARFEDCVNGALQVSVTQGQFDALVSFAFNLGCGNLRKSTLLRKLNADDADGAAAEFAVWNRAAGRVMAGLTRRREAERDLFSA